MNDKQQYLLATLLFLLVSGIFYYPLFFGKVLIFKDNLLHLAPALAFFKESLSAGQFPLWNPQIFAGLPFVADPSYGWLLPLNLLVFFLQPLTVIAVQAWLFTGLSGLGVYYLGRKLNLPHPSALVAALIYGFSGSVLEAANDVNSLAGMMFLPWVIGVFFAEVRERRYLSLRLSLILTAAIFFGHTQYAFLSLVVVSGSYVYHFVREKQKKAIFLGAMVNLLLVVGLTAIQWLPDLELVLASRVAVFSGVLEGERLTLMTLPRLLLPKIYGSLVEGNSWGPRAPLERGWGDVYGYISWAAWVIIGIGLLITKKRKKIWFLLAGAIVALILSLGSQTPLYGVVHALPGFSLFRSPYRFLSLYSLALSLAAGVSLAVIEKIRPSKYQARVLAIGQMTISIILGSLLLLWLAPSWRSFIAQKLMNLSQFLLALGWDRVRIILRLCLESGIIAVVGSLAGLMLIFAVRKPKNRWHYLGFLLIIIELFLANRGNWLFAPSKLVQQEPEVVKYLQANLKHERFISTGDTEPYTGIWVYFNHLVVRPPFSSELVTSGELADWYYLKKELGMLPVNTNHFYGLKSALGYGALVPKDYTSQSVEPRLNSIAVGNYDNQLLSELAVKYLVTGVPEDMFKFNTTGNYRLVWSSANYQIYENLKAVSRAELTGNQSEVLEWLADENNYLAWRVSTKEPASFVIRDLFFPGWEAWINGRRVNIERTEPFFRKVAVPSGKSIIEMRYRPINFMVGAIISGFAFFVVVVMWWKARLCQTII